MEHFTSDKGWRRLRTGETVLVSDLQAAGYGCFERVRRSIVGKTVIAGDLLYRARVRALSKTKLAS